MDKSFDKQALILYGVFLGAIFYITYTSNKKLEKDIQRRVKEWEARIGETLSTYEEAVAEKAKEQ